MFWKIKFKHENPSIRFKYVKRLVYKLTSDQYNGSFSWFQQWFQKTLLFNNLGEQTEQIPYGTTNDD